MTNIDSSGHWCESADGKWAHSGACESSTSTFSDDMDHDGQNERYNGFEPPGSAFYYPLEDRYVRWVSGDNKAYDTASDDAKGKMRTELFKHATADLGSDYFVNGLFWGLTLVSGVAEFNALKLGAGALRNGSLSSLEARQWYLAQEASIPSRLDTSLSLEQQAFQAFKLRNQFRTKARDLMSDRALAESLARNEKNLTWQQVVQKQIDKGYSGEDIWKAIIESSQRSRQSVNESLGIK